MAFLPGLKKQLNKANQFMSEKIGGVEGTKLNNEFKDMERRTDLTVELVGELITRTREYLQPNPTNRSKMMLSVRNPQNTRTRLYAQPEGLLGETLLRVALKFGEDSPYIRSLMETGEAFKQMAEIKYALEDDIIQDFIEPLTSLQEKELAEVGRHRKKLESRRLDFDCKKRRLANGSNIPDEEMKIAEDKFEESFNLASQGMHNLLQNDVEQISQLVALVEALRDYYKSCGSILEGLSDKLGHLRDKSASRQHPEYVPKRLLDLNIQATNSVETSKSSTSNNVVDSNSSSENNPADNNSNHVVEPDSRTATTEGEARKHGLCVALYDFQAENAGELGFKEGETLKLFDQIDENWYEGGLDGPNGGQTGIFPTNYVKVTKPIPATNGV